MKIIDIQAPDTFEVAVEAIHRGPIVLQLPTVFGLFAAPTQRGVDQLDAAKARLPNKNYGTFIGSLERFLQQVRKNAIPQEFSTAESFSIFSDAFIRLPIRAPDFDSPTIRSGTHQGLLVTGLFRELARAIESSFLDREPDAIWGGRNLSAAICSSCNVSGAPGGAITDCDQALTFAQERNIEVLITSDMATTTMGSYPIFGFDKDHVSVHRSGPSLHQIQQLIPKHLRSW